MKTTLVHTSKLREDARACVVLLVGLVGIGLARPAAAHPTPPPLAVDVRAVTGSNSNANGVLEPGETVEVDPSWTNTSPDPQPVTGTAPSLTGLSGPTYTINDASANYGTVDAGATVDCHGASGDCYLMTVSGTRPAPHWDAVFREDLSSDPTGRYWTIHVGNSFSDVPVGGPFYASIETIFHNGITAGCNAPGAPPAYCRDHIVTRAQLAVFLLKAKLGASHVPPRATGTVFGDVHVGDFAADWIEELAVRGITRGCGDGNYCPTSPVTRAQIAVLLLKSEHDSPYAPPACTGLFADVPCPRTAEFPFSDWIEQLFREGITSGCATAPPGGLPDYCPGELVTRGEAAVFLVRTFNLLLYGPPRRPQVLTATWHHSELCPGDLSWGFSPSTIHIHTGDTVEWVWAHGFFNPDHHSTTSADGLWDSGVQTAPYTFSQTFSQPGSFAYSCSHGHTRWHVYCFLGCYCEPNGTIYETGTVVVDP